MEQNVLDEKFNGLEKLLDERFKSVHTVLDRLEKQTTKTNGRVSTLEMWRSYLTGGLAVIGLFVGWLMRKL